MKLMLNQTAPDFSINDVYGRSVSIAALKGRNIYLAFERNAGCPVCNLRVHNLLKTAEGLLRSATAVVLVYESTPEKMREYLGNNTYPFFFVADPENVLYDRYGVERSATKFMLSVFRGLIGKAKAGAKLFKKPIKQDGNVTRIPSEFIIDRQGKLAVVHYGGFVGDHLPIDFLEKRLAESHEALA